MRMFSVLLRTAMRRRDAGLLAFLCFVFIKSLAAADGLAASGVAHPNEVLISSQAEALDALHSLEDGQALYLNISILVLNSTVTIKANNVTVKGAASITRVRCPSKSSAFKIEYAGNVTFSNLEISSCLDSALSFTLRDEVVRVVNCRFQNNVPGFNGGGAIYVLNATLHVENTNFTNNGGPSPGQTNSAVRRRGAVHAINEETRNEGYSCHKDYVESGRGGAVYASRSAVIIIKSNFAGNRASNDGGALYVEKHSSLNVTECKFENNTANRNGGAVQLECVDRAVVNNSVFKGNKAIEKSHFRASGGKGGGLYSIDGIELNILESTFTNNQAAPRDGGAVYVEKTESLSTNDSTFEENSAQGSGGAIRAILTKWNSKETTFTGNSANQDGGAASLTGGSWQPQYNNLFEKNNATLGGAVYLEESAKLSGKDTRTRFRAWREAKLVTVHTSFGMEISYYDYVPHSDKEQAHLEGNVAVRGGGLFCHRCIIEIRSFFSLVGNVALVSGGGMHVIDSDSLSINSAAAGKPKFQSNVAAVGGGLFIKDSRSAKVFRADFERNMAIDGGGFFLISEHGLLEDYYFSRMTMKNNTALNLTNTEVGQGVPAVLTWLQEREKTLSRSKPDWIQAQEDRQGKGGAGYIALRNRRDDSSVTISFNDLEVEQNSAGIGGGLYIENRGIDSVSSKCNVEDLLRQSCLSVVFRDVRIVSNTARIAAGGLFMFSPKGIETYGLTESQLFGIECEDRTYSSDRTICVRGNRLLGDDTQTYGAQFATGAWSLTVEGVAGVLSLHAGGPLTLHKNHGNGALSNADGLTVVVKDWLNQTIRGDIADARLAVVLLSKSISGDRRYQASNGIVKIDSTTVIGYDVSDVVAIQSDDNRRINTTVEFRTDPCQDGELPTKNQAACFRCPSQAYSFFADNKKCRPCEKHAQCSGTTELVPDDGYWHSNPFSPYIRRCPSKSACSFTDRKANLSEYYNDPKIKDKLQLYNATWGTNAATWIGSYNQCATGYEGVLCGTCEEGYGHSAGGGCKLCSQGLKAARLTAVLSVGVLFLVLTTKVILGVDGVLKYIIDELRKERSAVASTLLECCRATKHEERKAETSTDDTTPVGASSRSRGIEGAETADHSGEEGPSTAAAEVRPLLQRAEQNIEDPAAEDSSVHAETQSAAAVAASGLLVATYNILFNYVQLSTAALSLSVNWRTALNQLLAINGVLGRVMRLEFLPFDCTFSDRNDDVGTPNSLLVLWFRILFPFMAVAFYLTVVGLIKVVRGEIKTSKYKVDPLPSLRLLFLVVYLAYCIDIVSDLLQVFNCYDLSADYQEDHPYNAFEHLDLVSVWMQDTSVTCWRDAHQVSAILAAIGLAVCSMIITFMVAIVAKGSREGRLNQPEFVRRYGILFIDYRREGLALHWESVITVRRMLLAAIEVYSGNRETSGVRIGMLAIVIFAALAVHDIVQPFEEETEEETFPSYAGSEVGLIVPEEWRRRWVTFNRSVTLNGMEGASLFMALSFFLVAGCISDDRAKEYETDLLLTACFVLNAVYFLFMVYRLWYGLHLYLDALADERELVFTNATNRAEDRSTYLIVKVWKLATFKRERNVDSALLGENE